MDKIHSRNPSPVGSLPRLNSPPELRSLPLIQMTHEAEHDQVPVERYRRPDLQIAEPNPDAPEAPANGGEENQSAYHDLNTHDTPGHVEATTHPLLNTEKAGTVLKGWPEAPQLVRSAWWIIACDIILDVSLFASAVALLVFAISVKFYDGASTSENPRTTQLLLNATNYGPTVFPILFALILGRVTHALMRWRLECGERIGVLDTLAASTSLTSTFVSQFRMRTISVFGIALMVLWALSPIGGQASLRQMTVGIRDSTYPATFNYMVHNGYIVGFMNSSRVILWSIIDSMFISAIIGSATARSSPRDAWGNIKIPRLEHYEDSTTPNKDGWFETSNGSSDTYSSMIGIPISGTDLTGFTNYQMHIQTSYLQILCSQELMDQTGFVLANFTQPGMERIEGIGAVILIGNNTLRLRANRDPDSLVPLQFQYWTKEWSLDNFRLICNLTSSYVEAQVTCPQSTSCAVNKIRRSQLDSPPPAWSLLDLGMPDSNYLFRQILNSSSSRNLSPTLLDKYMSNPDAVISRNEVFAVPLTTEENYSTRMTQLINSYFTVINGMYTITGGLNNDSAYFWDKNISFVPQGHVVKNRQPNWLWFPILDNGERKAKVWPAEGTKIVSTEVIIAHLPWVITLCVTSIVLIVASLVSPIVHFFLITGPEVMMNFSSLAARDNRYIPLPEGGTHLGASARARLLKDVVVRHGDKRPESGVGYLVIGDARGDLEIARTRKQKLYE